MFTMNTPNDLTAWTFGRLSSGYFRDLSGIGSAKTSRKRSEFEVDGESFQKKLGERRWNLRAEIYTT